MGIWVITIRSEGKKFAEGHIGTDGYDFTFCGLGIPEQIKLMWDDPRNPYKGRGNVTCMDCLEEFNEGRRSGHRVAGDGMASVEDPPEATEGS